MKQDPNEYIISGGEEGKKRLTVLSEVLAPYTASLLEKDGSIVGKHMLDLGCGGGNVSLMAARMVGNSGHVTGVDFDETIINLARKDAAAQGVNNVSFEVNSAYEIAFNGEFDIAYSRFLLSHLKEPAVALKHMLKSVKPAGRVIVEDVHFSGHFCYPPSKAFDEYIHYYTTAAVNNGQNPEIGPALFSLFHEAGIREVHFDVIQPAFHNGSGKWMGYITMDKIKAMVVKQQLATESEIEKILRELEAFTKDEQTIISLPRIFRVWGISE